VAGFQIAAVLYDAEFRNDLETDLYRWVSLDPDEEASLSVDETNHPIWREFHLDSCFFALGELDARRIVSEDPPRGVSCGLSNPDHCY